jgi:hypothetical protein
VRTRTLVDKTVKVAEVEGETITVFPQLLLLETLSVTFTTRTRSPSRLLTRVELLLVPLEDEEAGCSRTEDEVEVLLEVPPDSGADEVDSKLLEAGVTGDPSEVDGVLTVDEAGEDTAVGTR